MTDTQAGYNAITDSTEFTLTFADSGIGDNSWVEVSAEIFVNNGDGRYEWIGWPHSVYLAKNGGFIPNYIDPEERVALRAGESVRFTLPRQSEFGEYDPVSKEHKVVELTDAVYRLRVEKFYPDAVDPETGSIFSYYFRPYFKVDSAAVDEALANMAYANTQTVLLDGKPVTFETYALKDENGNLANYIKVRDLAFHLNGTKARFEVSYRGRYGIFFDSGVPYNPNGTELSTPFSGNQPCGRYSHQTTVNGKSMDLDTISLDGGGFTYYKLRELGRALDFNVSYIDGQVVIDTSEPYSDAQ